MKASVVDRYVGMFRSGVRGLAPSGNIAGCEMRFGVFLAVEISTSSYLAVVPTVSNACSCPKVTLLQSPTEWY